MGILNFLKNTEKNNTIQSDDVSQPFVMEIDDVFSIPNKGTAVTGKITDGAIKLNEEVFVNGGNQQKSVKIINIEKRNKFMNEARAGDDVSLLLGNISQNEVKKGYIITTDRDFSTKLNPNDLKTDNERMESVGLKMYIWETSNDERVCKACKLMDGKLCIWSDSTVYSRNKGKDWIPRPTGAAMVHPGEYKDCKDRYGCRCTAIAYYDELVCE